MLEIPESKTLDKQANQTLTGKTITEVIKASSPHKFAFYTGDPNDYPKLLKGKKILSAKGHGMFVDLACEDNTYITVGEGTNVRYCKPGEQRPIKHQLIIGFEDASCIAFTVAMYGGIWAYRGEFDNKYHRGSLSSVSPLENAFNESFFDTLIKNTRKELSLKAFLATEQRIPGLGNGVLQDILFNAGLNPKSKKSALTDEKQDVLFQSLKGTLQDMTNKGGRDTEKDFFGNSGGYKTLLSKNTLNSPCPKCGGKIVKEAYLGGAVYYCSNCQKK
jgi:formamidopyrimidine-DNA glycosylase